MKVCAECRWFEAGSATISQLAAGSSSKAQCKNPEAATRDPVFGKAYCELERSGAKGCGKAGKLWVSSNAK